MTKPSRDADPRARDEAWSSVYLKLPVRSLEQVCRELAGCAALPGPRCDRCSYGDLCPRARRGAVPADYSTAA